MTLLADRAEVLGCSIDRVDMSEAAERCDRFVRTRAGAQHMAVNAAKIVAMRHDEALHRLVDGCELITADGQAVVWASRLLGDPLPTRVAGIDLMLELLALAEDRGYRVYVLGARRDVLELAVARLRELHPRLEFAGYRDGYFSDADEPSVAAEIRAARPDLLFVAMSTPRKEYFLGRWGPELDARDGVRLAVLTGNLEPIAHLKLARAGLGRFFEHGQGGFGSDSEDRLDLPAIARRRAGSYPRANTVIIGDTPRDIACARADGVRCVAVATGPFGREQLAKADVVVESAHELLDVLPPR